MTNPRSYDEKSVDGKTEREYIFEKVGRDPNGITTAELEGCVKAVREVYGSDRTSEGIRQMIRDSASRNHVVIGGEKIKKEEIAREVQHDTVVQTLRARLRITESKYRQALNWIKTQEEITSEIQDRIISRPPVKIPKPIKLIKGGSSEETVVLLFSDPHVGEVVEKDQMGGIGEYDLQIFERRCERLTEVVIDLTKEKLKGYCFNKLVVAGLGDIISGIIHQDLIEFAGGGTVYDWLFTADRVISNMIVQFAREFPKVEFLGVIGNHGRLQKEIRFKNRYLSWDYLVYKMVEKSLNRQENVQFFIPKCFFIRRTIENNNFLFMHGDNINSWAGIPWYGIDRASKRMMEVFASQEEFFKYIVLAHFHNCGMIDRVCGETVINGSMIGPNDFSLGKMFTGSEPSQLLFGVHKKYGISWRYKIRL